MNKKNYIAFDFGAESGRAIAVSLEEGHLSLYEVHRFHNKPLNLFERLHWDINMMFNEIKKSLRLASFYFQEEINGIAFDTWGIDFVLMDHYKQVLGFPLSYRDNNLDGVMEEFFKIIPREKIYEITGIQFLPFNSLYQLFSFKRDDLMPEDAERILFMPDLFNFMLTEKLYNEYTIATTSQLIDIRTGNFSEKLLKAAGFEGEFTYEIIHPGTVIGNTTRTVKRDTGVENIPVIATASHDTASAVAGIPFVSDNCVFISSGTWSLMGIITDEPIVSELGLKKNFTNEGWLDGKFRFLKNISGLWVLNRCNDVWNVDDYTNLMREAEKAQPFSFFFDVDDKCFVNPSNMIHALNTYCDKTSQKFPESPAQITRGILENLVFKYKKTLNELGKLTNRSFDRICIVGGGSQNRLLCQMTADATGIPVCAGPIEATAIGNAVVQGIALGHIKDLNEAREIIARSFEIKIFNPQNQESWNSYFSKYPDLCEGFK